MANTAKHPHPHHHYHHQPHQPHHHTHQPHHYHHHQPNHHNHPINGKIRKFNNNNNHAYHHKPHHRMGMNAAEPPPPHPPTMKTSNAVPSHCDGDNGGGGVLQSPMMMKKPNGTESWNNHTHNHHHHHRRKSQPPPPPPLPPSPSSNNPEPPEQFDYPPGEHPLHYVWSFWYLRFERNFSWEHSQQEIATVRTVESFWQCYNALMPLTESQYGCNYSLFKHGIRPIWEDVANRNGGRLVFTITKESSECKEQANRIWLEFSLALIGNMLPQFSHQICGMVGGNRNSLIKIALWTRDSTNLAAIQQIGKFFKKIANYDKLVPFEAHMDKHNHNNNGGGGGGRVLLKI